MKTSVWIVGLAALFVATSEPREASAGPPASANAPPTAAAIINKVIEADTWALGGTEVKARAVVTEKSGKTRELAFDAKSRQHAPPLGKSVISFSAPADVAGMKFLQIQNPKSDDERFLYTPELKRSRRIAATNR